MTDHARVMASALAGSLLGGIAGFLLFTSQGRRVRAGLQPQLAELLDEVKHLQQLALRMREAARDGWQHMSSSDGPEHGPDASWGDETRRH